MNNVNYWISANNVYEMQNFNVSTNETENSCSAKIH